MRIISYIIWPLLFIGQLLAASLLAWHLLAQVSFAYPLGYKLLGLEQHIADYAPRNHYKHGFEFTRPQEHWDLFAQITQAVQHSGKGLAEINYSLPNGRRSALMYDAEITHLQDVSRLIDKFYLVGTLGGLLWASCLWLAYRQKLRLPSLRRILLGFGIGLMTITCTVLMLGATKVFYWFHTQIFPAGHQWFFYYEDSLMTTLMKAPDIFAFIALLLLLMLALLWSLSTLAMASLLNGKQANTIPVKNPSSNKNNARKKK